MYVSIIALVAEKYFPWLLVVGEKFVQARKF